MRSTSILFAASVALLCGTVISSAADLMIEQAAAVETYDPADWSGLYAGLHIGLGSGVMAEQAAQVQASNGALAALGGLGADESGYEPSGLLAGAQMGGMFQTGMFVLGIQGDVSWANLEGGYIDLSSPPADDDVATIGWLGNLTGRAGVAFDQVLVYALAGLSMAGVSIDYQGEVADATFAGYTLGLGAAVHLDDSWSLFAEYAFSSYGEETFDFPVALESYAYDLNVSTFKVGLNYGF